jgi:NDP-sugar pyrophosphorylase family protein
MNGSTSRELPTRLFDWADPFLQELFGSPPTPWEALDQLEDRLHALEIPCDSLESLQQRYPQTWFDPEGQYRVHSTARIEPGAFLSGAVVLRPGAFAGHACRIRGPVYLGPNSHVGHASEIKHSLLLEGAVAAHLNFVGDSILGERSNLGAGAVCANLRFDQRPIVVKVGDLRIQTSKRKCGAFVGVGAQIGCSATLSPGTVIGPRAWIGPNLSIRGWVPEGARILSSEGAGFGIA